MSYYNLKSQNQQHPFINSPSFSSNVNESIPLIEKIDNNNLHNTLHDNLNDKIKFENIKEYQITIDSLDRDLTFYPDPYNFRLSMTGPFTSPSINKSFRNVKYIKIDSLILPKYYDTKKESEEEESEYIDDENKDTTNERFIMLRFENINQTQLLGTNELSNRPSILFFPYKKYNEKFSLFKPVNLNTNILFVNDSNLINLSNIDFSLFNGKYEKLEFTNKNIEEKDNDNINSPLNINKQIIINLRIGVIENNMNTEINYR